MYSRWIQLPVASLAIAALLVPGMATVEQSKPQEILETSAVNPLEERQRDSDDQDSNEDHGDDDGRNEHGRDDDRRDKDEDDPRSDEDDGRNDEDDGRNGDGGGTGKRFTTAVTVDYQGAAAFLVSAEQVEPHLAPGYTLEECAPGLGHLVVVFVTQRAYVDLVPGTVREVMVLTCATPPPGYEHPNPVGGEPNWYFLYEASDSEEWIQFAGELGHTVDKADITVNAVDTHNFDFTAVLADDTLLANVAFSSPAVAAPVPFLPFSCEPGPSVGRALSPGNVTTFVSDWVKSETICAGGVAAVYDPTGPLGDYVGANAPLPVGGVVEVHSSEHTFFTLPNRPTTSQPAPATIGPDRRPQGPAKPVMNRDHGPDSATVTADLFRRQEQSAMVGWRGYHENAGGSRGLRREESPRRCGRSCERRLMLAAARGTAR